MIRRSGTRASWAAISRLIEKSQIPSSFQKNDNIPSPECSDGYKARGKRQRGQGFDHGKRTQALRIDQTSTKVIFEASESVARVWAKIIGKRFKKFQVCTTTKSKV